MNRISALYLPVQKDGWAPPEGGDSRRPEAGDKAQLSAFPVPNEPASRVEGKKTLCSRCVEAHITSKLVTRPLLPQKGEDNAFSSECHPSFAPMLLRNRSLLLLRRFAREGGPPTPEWVPGKPRSVFRQFGGGPGKLRSNLRLAAPFREKGREARRRFRLQPFSGSKLSGGAPLQFSPSRGSLSLLWPRKRLKRTGTEQAKHVVRNANNIYLLFRWTAALSLLKGGANTVVSNPKYLWWKQIRIWILTCRCFLTVGILPGSWWAHHESGRGGWWFRDLVENASSMPRVLATARIHPVIIPKSNSWTLFLNMVTLLCRVSGTFSVRSGLLASVHSPATDSTRGIFLWCFFLLITSISLILFL